MNKDMIEINDQINKGDNKMKKMKSILKNEKGLTLIELLAVIVILAIVAAIAVPSIGNIIENSKYNAVKADATNILNAAQLYFTDDQSKLTVTVAELKTAKYLESEGKIESGTVTKATPTTIQAGPIKYSGEKTVTFNGATLKQITDDSKKGSEAGPHTIGGTTTTPPTGG